MPLTYTWDVPSGVRGRYELSDSNRVLRINHVQQDDSGRYSCRVESGRNIGQQSDIKDYILYVECKFYTSKFQRRPMLDIYQACPQEYVQLLGSIICRIDN